MTLRACVAWLITTSTIVSVELAGNRLRMLLLPYAQKRRINGGQDHNFVS